MPQVRESIVHLYSLGRYQDVQVEAAAAPAGGVLVTFNLIPMHNVNRIEFAGTLGSVGRPAEAHGRRALRPVAVGRPHRRRGANAAAALRRQRLSAREGRDVHRSSPQSRPHAPDVHHRRRDRARPSRRSISRAIRGRPGTISSIESAPRSARPTSGRSCRRSSRATSQRLRDRRYYEAEATLRGVESEDGSTVALSIDIDSGRPVTVRFAGDPIPEDRLKELAPLETEGTVNEDLLEDSEARLENYLRQQGYWKADVAVQREESDGRRRRGFHSHAWTAVSNRRRRRDHRLAGTVLDGSPGSRRPRAGRALRRVAVVRRGVGHPRVPTVSAASPAPWSAPASTRRIRCAPGRGSCGRRSSSSRGRAR